MRIAARIIVIISAMFSLAMGENLFVFYPTTLYPQFLQAKMATKFPGVSVQVLGRYEDFLLQVQTSSPEIIVTVPELASQLPSYTVVLQGEEKGSKTQQYFFLSLNPKFTEKNASQSLIGVIDFLGKKDMESGLQKVYGSGIRLKRIRKVEDLLPLLMYNMVDAILIPDHFIPFFKKQSSVPFYTYPSLYKTQLVSVSVKNGTNPKKVLPRLDSLGTELFTLFGVEKWKQ